MHAVVLHTYGPAENLRYETVPDPEPGPGQVRIAVKAIGVHYVDTVMRTGAASSFAPPPPALPAVLGVEVAGTVDSVGPGADPSWTGRDVVTTAATTGGYAELALAGTDSLHPVPGGLSHETAAAMVMTGATALGLLDVARLTADDTVVITSAAGGIGRLAVQYARGVGARVVGAAGGPVKTAAVRALGAEIAVDYDEPHWEQPVRAALGGNRATVVLDGVSGDKGRAAFGLLADGGRYVNIGSSSGQGFEPDAEELKSRRLTSTSALLHLLDHPEESPALQRRALAAAAAGALTPGIQTYPLARAAAAHTDLENRNTTGKVLLVP